MTTCEECDSSHYLISGHCCKYGYYPGAHDKDEECSERIEGSECRTYDTNDDCETCYDGYYKVDGENQCC